MAHLFSCTLYFVLDFPTGFENCDPHPLYFWVYFVAFNSPWILASAKQHFFGRYSLLLIIVDLQ